jgi:hypothetical protein
VVVLVVFFVVVVGFSVVVALFVVFVVVTSVVFEMVVEVLVIKVLVELLDDDPLPGGGLLGLSGPVGPVGLSQFFVQELPPDDCAPQTISSTPAEAD